MSAPLRAIQRLGAARSALAACALLAAGAAGEVRAADPLAATDATAPIEGAFDNTAVSLTEADAIFRTLHLLLAGKTAVMPSALNRSAGGVIVTLHTEAPPEVCFSGRPTLAAALGDAGEELGRRVARRADHERALRDGRLQVDIVTTRAAVEYKDRMALWKSLTPGADGLLLTAGGRTAAFTPSTIMYQWQSLDLVASLYVTQEREQPPAAFTAERFRAQSLIEEKAHGRVTPFARGIIPRESIQPSDAVESVARAGLWFMRTQQKDGAFFPRYTPALDLPPGERYSHLDHLRAMIALNMLYEVTGDDRFDAAFERALTHLQDAKLVRTEERYSWVALDGGDDITGTALLLSALCGRTLTHKGSTMTALMRQLGDTLTTMVSDDGRLYARLVNARHKLPPYQLRGEPHAEALAALMLLQRVSPAEKTQAAAGRIADVLSVIPEFRTLKAKDGKMPENTEPGRFVLTHSDHRTMSRVLEALADFDRQTRSEKHLPAIRDLVALLMNAQIAAARGQPTGSVGGVEETKDSPPETQTTGAYLSAVCAAYDYSMANRRQEQPLAGAALRAAVFLINMQHRSETMLRVARPEALAGAFRRAPDDVSVQTVVTAEAVRGLIRCVPVIAENVAPAARQ